jgi:hypothetical protein
MNERGREERWGSTLNMTLMDYLFSSSAWGMMLRPHVIGQFQLRPGNYYGVLNPSASSIRLIGQSHAEQEVRKPWNHVRQRGR